MDKEQFDYHLQKSNEAANILHSTDDDTIAKKAYDDFKREEEILNTLLLDNEKTNGKTKWR